MKNRAFGERLTFALRGIGVAFRREASLRLQRWFALAALAALVVLRPAPVWWAIVFLSIVVVLALELMNTALELVIDRLHPDVHPMIGQAKDCAAGAVLLASLGALAVALALVTDYFLKGSR